MNNFQNGFGKCVSPATTVANRNESDEKKRRSDYETRPTGPLKIFYESKNFHVHEPRFEWNLNKPRKKTSSRLITLRTAADTKKRNWKTEKRIKYEGATEENSKRPCFLTTIESQVSKTKPRRTNQKESVIVSHCSLQKNDSTKNQSIPEKYFASVEPERAPLNSLFTPSKSKGEDKKTDKLEITIKPRVLPFSSNKLLSSKPSEKMPNSSSEMKATISDSGKRRINEILKNHAQKVQSTPTKTIQIKDYTINVLDPSKKGKNVSIPDSEVKDGKEPASKTAGKPKKNEEIKLEPSKTKSAETEKKDSKEGRDKAEDEDKTEEKKKFPAMWLKLPQSNELERRLKNSWQGSGSLLSNEKDMTGDNNLEGEKNSVSEKEDDKNDKRVTYTDRLLLLKMLGKNLEEKKQKATADEVQLKEVNNNAKASKEISESFIKKSDNISVCRQTPTPQAPVQKEVMNENKSFNSFKEERYMDSERVYKTKQTRSAELRDLVAQAIKEHKIFCIFDNHTYIVRPVREELLNRGWLEVIPDRRLIPRRRPPPMGPIYERDKMLSDRNCNTLEAVLAAKETFVDEIQDTVSKSSFKFGTDKTKLLGSVTVIKKSEESLTDALSLFRIIPPLPAENKKNNSEIREFVAKYQAYVEKEKEREREIKALKEKEKNAKNMKKDKIKMSTQNQKNKPEEKASQQDGDQAPLSKISNKSFQEIWDSINDNKKLIMQASEIKTIDGNSAGKAVMSALYETQKKTAASENKKEESNIQKTPPRSIFSESEAKTISKIIQSSNARIHFMWLSIKPGIHLKCFNYSPEIVNKFQKTTFCTKIGLWSHLSNMQWYAHEVSFPAKSPRMYNTGEADDMQAFFQDFQLTACIGMLKWLCDTFFEKGLKAVQTKRGKVPLKAFEFAIKQCEKYMRFKDNEELNVTEEPSIHQEEWNTFLQWFYIITNDHGKIQESSSAQLMVLYTKAVETLKMMKRHWPEIDIDGRLNIWIMKPYCASCGRGIFMTNNVYYISQHSKYIVQKYIEKPLLIYNTKFDIRQWFMITKLTPLEIWMYRECYLRFCSQPFALRNLHESVHLSNNSVQRKYIGARDSNLPDQNMWDSNTFQLYLKTIGHPSAWEEIIYPGMRDAIVSTMLAAQDTFDGPRKSWFEVYGADFMLSSNVREGPWLIEINENPAMDPSTKVTARLCPQMLRDVIKVVVDKRANKNANTGQWELIYRQNYSPSFGTVDLDVRGRKIAKVPYPAKVNLNVQPITNKSSKVQDPSTLDPNKLYEFVKSLGTVKKSKQDPTGLEKSER